VTRVKRPVDCSWTKALRKQTEVDMVRSSFELFIRKPLVEIIYKWTNKKGRRVYKDKSNEESYKIIGLMVLIGVYKSKGEDICQIWSLKNGRPIFNKIMSRQRLQDVLRFVRFDNAEYRRQHRCDYKLEPIWECYDFWVNNLR
jgi:hypothetical protein